MIVPFAPGPQGSAQGPQGPLTAGPTQPPPKPVFQLMAAVQMHNEGRLIQKVGDETTGDFDKGNDTGFEEVPPYATQGDHTLRIQQRNKVDTFEYNGPSTNEDMDQFIKDKKLKPGDVFHDSDDKYWMHMPTEGDEPKFMQVRPKAYKATS